MTENSTIQEYVGEVIDETTKNDRLLEWARDHPNDPNFYFMRLETGWYIDAREVANTARFINHSCDPNCKLVPVNVAGRMRVSIVCIIVSLNLIQKYLDRCSKKETDTIELPDAKRTIKGKMRNNYFTEKL